MEGVAGIVDWSQCRAPGQPYEEGRRLLGEVNAVVDGAMAGGATEIVCHDSHGTGGRTVSIRDEDPLAMYRSFVAVTYITRVAEGRLRGLTRAQVGEPAAAPVT